MLLYYMIYTTLGLFGNVISISHLVATWFRSSIVYGDNSALFSVESMGNEINIVRWIQWVKCDGITHIVVAHICL